MRAILRTGFGGPEKLVIREIPEPEPKDGHAVIEVKAFGLNHAELHMRKGEWAEIADVSGIECVGIVKSCPGAEFAAGTKGVCIFYLGDFHAAARWGWDQKPSHRLPPLTYRARSVATVAAPSSTQRMPEPFKRSPMILQPASVGPLPMSQPLFR